MVFFFCISKLKAHFKSLSLIIRYYPPPIFEIFREKNERKFDNKSLLNDPSVCKLLFHRNEVKRFEAKS